MKVVVVFSGGGVKALAHLGAYRALREAGLEPAQYVATSFGSVIAAALAAGATYETVVSGTGGGALRSRDIAPLELLALVKGVFTDHLIKPGPLRDTIARLVPARRWEDLKVPLTVTVVDLDSGALKLCGTGHPRAKTDIPLHDALYASCALPFYYPPLVVDGHRYSEGGLRAVLPLEAARAIPAELVVAVHVGPGFDETATPGAPAKIPGLVRAYGDTIRILMAGQTEQAVAAWPKDAPRLVLVRPVHEKEATFAVEHAARYLEAGYQMTKAALA